jgi:hypothetical protein
MSQTITGLFESRREAEMAVEHLVQEHGIERKQIQAQAAGSDNSSGTSLTGADAAHAAEGEDVAAKQGGRIAVTVTVTKDNVKLVQDTLKTSGASKIR